jgi:predicted nuclease of predicted toxin-antitoxin system
MKLLFDENISYRIIKRIETIFPESSHVKFFNMLQTNDTIVREFAKEIDFMIVTNDSDFNDLVYLYGFPPKVVWLKTGNTATQNIVELLTHYKQEIIEFSKDTENGILVIEK